MFGLKSLVAGLLAVAATGVVGYGDPGSCSGDCWAHDPAVIQRSSDGEYFRFNTGSLIGIWKSSALEGPWVYQGAAIPAGSIINLDGNDDLWVGHVNTRHIYIDLESGQVHSGFGTPEWESGWHSDPSYS